MTTQNVSAPATKTPAKCYNMLGVVSDVSLKTASDSKAYATFNLTKGSDSKVVKCVVFAEHIEKVSEAVKAAAGAPVKLFGRYDRRSFQAEDGSTKTAVRFRTLWAGLPKAKEAEAEDERAESVGF